MDTATRLTFIPSLNKVITFFAHAFLSLFHMALTHIFHSAHNFWRGVGRGLRLVLDGSVTQWILHLTVLV